MAQAELLRPLVLFILYLFYLYSWKLSFSFGDVFSTNIRDDQSYLSFCLFMLSHLPWLLCRGNYIFAPGIWFITTIKTVAMPKNYEPVPVEKDQSHSLKNRKHSGAKPRQEVKEWCHEKEEIRGGFILLQVPVFPRTDGPIWTLCHKSEEMVSAHHMLMFYSRASKSSINS